MIKLSSVSLRIGAKQILKDVSFAVPTGKTLALIGESGGGKTSIARLLLGLLDGRHEEELSPSQRNSPDFVWSGEAWVDGVDMLRASASEKRRVRGRNITMIVQALSDALNPHLTVLQHIQEVIDINRLQGADARDLCLLLDISEWLHTRLPSGLSGGEIQRVLTALATVPEPKSLVLDEPTASLDPANLERAVQRFEQGKEQRAQLLITHDIRLAQRMSDDVAILYKGQILEQGPTQDVLRQPERNYSRSLLEAAKLERQKQSCTLQQTRTTEANRAGLFVTNLSHSYDERRVVNHVSFHVATGECLAITGESGGGKTTIARLLSGLEQIQSGEIRWRGPDSGESASGGRFEGKERAGHAALISQFPQRAMARHFTARKVLEEAVFLSSNRASKGNWGRHSFDCEELISHLLQQVGLPATQVFLSTKVQALSGGEAQRLVIARALAQQPDYLILDEPTYALDLCAQKRVLELLMELKSRKNLSLILFTHDQAVANYLADKHYHL